MKLTAIAILAACSLLPAASRAADVVSAETSVTTTYKRCSAIHGARFRLSEGGEVGTIEDVIFDPAEGRIVTVITSYEGRYVPVPWTMISVGGPEERIVTVNVNRETFINAPTIERTNITNITTLNPQILQRSDTFFRERVTTRDTRTNGTVGTVRTQEGSGGPPSGTTRLQTDTSVGTQTGTRMKNQPGTNERRREANPPVVGEQGNRVKGSVGAEATVTGTNTRTHKDVPESAVPKSGRKLKATEDATVPPGTVTEPSTKTLQDTSETTKPVRKAADDTTTPSHSRDDSPAKGEKPTHSRSLEGKHLDKATPVKKHPAGDPAPTDATKKADPADR